MNELLPHTTATAIVAHRDAAVAKMAEAVRVLAAGFALAREAEVLAQRAHGAAVFLGNDRSRGESYRQLFQDFNAERSAGSFREQVDARTWMNLLTITGATSLMDKGTKEELHSALAAEVPEVTEANIEATFKSLAADANLIFQRGLARAFGDLDRRFKSHDAFKIGSRIILTNVFDQWGHWNYHSRMRDTLQDIERVFAVLDRTASGSDFRDSIRAVERDRRGSMSPSQSCTDTEFFRIRGYMNGNAHLWFKRDDLVERANRVLAEYYGEVLPDGVPADGASEADIRSKSGALSKDLAFYPTPVDVVRRYVLADIHLKGAKVLEPSAGTGNMVRAILANAREQALDAGGVTVHAIEVDLGRARQIEALADPRVTVQHANFLRVPATPRYTHVVMNPPFYGTHWMEHVMHAFDFLAPGGVLVAVLPVTAELGQSRKHVAFRKWASAHTRWGAEVRFTDLPPETFKEAGTMVNTVLVTLYKGKQSR